MRRNAGGLGFTSIRFQTPDDTQPERRAEGRSLPLVPDSRDIEADACSISSGHSLQQLGSDEITNRNTAHRQQDGSTGHGEIEPMSHDGEREDQRHDQSAKGPRSEATGRAASATAGRASGSGRPRGSALRSIPGTRRF